MQCICRFLLDRIADNKKFIPYRTNGKTDWGAVLVHLNEIRKAFRSEGDEWKVGNTSFFIRKKIFGQSEQIAKNNDPRYRKIGNSEERKITTALTDAETLLKSQPRSEREVASASVLPTYSIVNTQKRASAQGANERNKEIVAHLNLSM